MAEQDSSSVAERRLSMPRRPGPWRIANIIDGRALRVKLTAAALDSEGNEKKMRSEALDILHSALFRGRLIAQERLQQGADGLDTARLLAAVQDEVLHALYDFTTTHVFRARNPTEGERLSVFATGGYGRGVLAPSSDIDLLFLRPYKSSPFAESVIEYMLYTLWDMGLKVGHAFRTPQECIRLSKEDVTIKTSLLDTRFLFGDKELAESTAAQFNKQVVFGQDAQFISDKLQERDRRHARQGDARFVVEPNVKEGKGGLRDLQTLYWIVKHLDPVNTTSLEDVMANDMFTNHEHHVFMRAARFLWTVRCHLHYVTGRADERLSFDLQPELAARMGYTDRGSQLGVERFMKRYFLAAKDVGGLTRILAAKLEAQQKKKPEGWRRLLPTGAPKSVEDPLFHIEAGRLAIKDEEAFLSDPTGLLRLFMTADMEEIDIHPDAMSLASRNTRLINQDNRDDPRLSTAFLSILLESKTPQLALNRMNEAGVLGRLVPEFGGIVGQTQFNMYHHYTVDEHTLRAVGHMAAMQRGETGFELAEGLFNKISHRRALYLAMLLHDTGKGLGDQQVEGMKTARAAGKRLGLDEGETELIAWLVGNHLEMSETAQKRDISDPRTIATFAKLVGDTEHLRLLYILTVADIRAVGPNVWNTWKGQLLSELYHATEAALRGGRTDEASIVESLHQRANTNRSELLEALNNVPGLMLELDDSYWTGFDQDTLAMHAGILAAENDTVVVAQMSNDGARTELFVTCPDEVGIFARLVAAISAENANIIAAQVFTAKSGRIVDVFILQDDEGLPYAAGDEFRLKRLEQSVRAALSPDAVPAEIKQTPTRREAAFMIRPQVTISEKASRDFTVIDISGRDQPGLLRNVAMVLAEAGISIVSAHVGSYGERVFDAFYVRLPGDFDAAMKSSLRERLLAAVGRDEPDAPSTPARKLQRAAAADSF